VLARVLAAAAWLPVSGGGSVAADVNAGPLVLADEQRLANDRADQQVGSCAISAALPRIAVAGGRSRLLGLVGG
jgi:hypothetical protein